MPALLLEVNDAGTITCCRFVCSNDVEEVVLQSVYDRLGIEAKKTRLHEQPGGILKT